MKFSYFRKLVTKVFSSLRFRSKQDMSTVDVCVVTEVCQTVVNQMSLMTQPMQQTLVLLPKISFPPHANDDYFENVLHPFPRKY